MRFVLDNGLIQKDETVIISIQHQSPTLTSVSDQSTKVEHSINGIDWTDLILLNPFSSQQVNLTNPYLRVNNPIYLFNARNSYNKPTAPTSTNPVLDTSQFDSKFDEVNHKVDDITTTKLPELETKLESNLAVVHSSLINSIGSVQNQVDYLRSAELPQYALNSQLQDINHRLNNLPDLSQYVLKGQNGTWQENPTTAVTDCFTPTIIGYYSPETVSNRPSSYGSLHSFSSKGTLTKQHNNWITTIAFSTDARIFYTQSINAGQTAWFEFATTESRQAIIQSNGIQMGQNISVRNVTANGYVKRTAKLSSTTPARSSGKTINHPFNRSKITGISYRIDGDGFSSCEGLAIEIHDTYFNVESIFTNAQLGNKPVTFYIDYEP